jgi:fibronectin type 3 domain-containing protein
MFTVDFKVIDTDRPVTKVAFKIVEFQGADEEFNVTHNTDTPATFKTISTDTFEKTIITGVTPAAKGMQINWKATEGVDKYVVYKAKDNGGWQNINNNVSASDTSYVDTTARHGVKETYAVRAFKKNADGEFYSAKTYNTVSGLYVAPVAKVTTANSGDGVKISWSAVSGANNYRVYKRVTNADGTKTGWMTLVSNTTAKSYVDTNVANDVKYEYIVRAQMNKVWSANSAASAIYHYDAPTVKIASAKGGAKVTWNAIDGAETYKIYRRNNGTSAWTLLKTVNADTLSYLDAAATSGKKLDYTVKAISSKGSSNYVAKTINYVATPKLTSLANGTSGATLKWSAVKGATTYRVYRKVVGAKSWTALVDVKTTSYVDKTAKSGTKYAYTVKAFNGKVASGYDSTGLTLKYLVMPKITKLTNTTAGINIKWSATTGASTGYKVYRKAPGETSWKLLGTVKTTSYTDKNVANGKTYKYTIRAVDGSNLSAYNSTGTSIKRVK